MHTFEETQPSATIALADTGMPTVGPAAPSFRATKSAIVTKLLSRTKGATLGEISGATGWQPHSCRAFLTGLRKKGKELIKEQRADGATSYRIAVTVPKIAAP